MDYIRIYLEAASNDREKKHYGFPFQSNVYYLKVRFEKFPPYYHILGLYGIKGLDNCKEVCAAEGYSCLHSIGFYTQQNKISKHTFEDTVFGSNAAHRLCYCY